MSIESSEAWYTRPVFFVADCAESLRFYEKLGFHEAWRYEEDGSVIVAQVDREGAELILCQNAKRAGGGRLFVSLSFGQANRLAAVYSKFGIEMPDSRWGMPVKVVTDPDGNEILFSDDELNAG